MSARISILFLMDQFVCADGGTEQHLLFLQRRLPRDRFQPHFALLTGLGPHPAPPFPLPPAILRSSRSLRPLRALDLLWRLAAHIRKVQADVVHAFDRQSEALAIFATKMACRGKVLGVRRNIGYWHTRRSLWWARLVGALGAEYAANCEAARTFAVRAEWIPRRRIGVIPNPVPTARLAAETGPARPAWDLDLGIVPGEKVVGIVATVRPVKDHATFLRAAKLVLARHPRTRFLIIGREVPEYASELKCLASQLEIASRVEWLGPLDNPLPVVQRFDVAVLCSQSEAMSNSLLEYALAGAATVATKVGGTPEVVEEGCTGLLVPPQSPELLADRICQLLSDDQLKAQLGRNARTKVLTTFNETTILGQYADRYCRMAGKTLLI